jgi:hypothetical protein
MTINVSSACLDDQHGACRDDLHQLVHGEFNIVWPFGVGLFLIISSLLSDSKPDVILRASVTTDPPKYI